MSHLRKGTQFVELERTRNKELVEGLVHLGKKGGHDWTELTHLKKESNQLTLGSEEGRGKASVVGVHVPGIYPYVIAEGVEDRDDMLYLWVVACLKELCGKKQKM